MFEINYSQLIQYEILEKLVTYMSPISHMKQGLENLSPAYQNLEQPPYSISKNHLTLKFSLQVPESLPKKQDSPGISAQPSKAGPSAFWKENNTGPECIYFRLLFIYSLHAVLACFYSCNLFHHSNNNLEFKFIHRLTNWKS